MKLSVSHAEGLTFHENVAIRAWLINELTLRQFMRISFVLVVLSCMSLTMLVAEPAKSQGAEGTLLTLELNGESLATALKKIEQMTPFRFVYRKKEIERVDNLYLPAGTRSVTETLEILLSNSSLTFRQINNNILIEALPSDSRSSGMNAGTEMVAEQLVSGRVTSADDGAPLPGVSVLVKGTQRGTVSDSNGDYSITVDGPESVLAFSFIGFETIETVVGERTRVDIAMSPNTLQLTEVVVTSFGIEQEKRSIGFSTQDIDGASLAQTRQPNLVSALQGQASGLQITNAGGAPGTSARIVIRGLTSLSQDDDNQPLFVVDGIPIDNSTYDSPNTPRGPSNRAADINPNDIESVNILKGAAATALYGVRAANGAVVITTKKGKEGGVRINLNSSAGFQNVNRFPDFQEEYGQGSFGNADRNSVFPAWGAPFSAAESLGLDPEYKYYDNYRNVMKTGTNFDNHVSISGGNDFAKFYSSVANTQQKGVIPFSTWDRTSAKFAGSLNFKDKLKVEGSITYTNSGGNRVPGDRFGETLMYYPTSSDVNDYENEDGTQKYIGLSDNPVYSAKYWTYVDDVDRTLGNIALTYQPVSWLSLNYRLGSDFYSDFREEILPGPKGIAGETPLSATGYIEHTRITKRILNSNFYAQITKEIGDVGVTFRLGNEVFQEELARLITTGNNFVIPEYYQFNNVRELLTDQYSEERRLVGFFGDLLLSYRDFLYLNITGRNDLSSTLPKRNNSFFYPSYNLSFIFSDVVELPEQVTFGKLRMSYGEAGKDTRPYKTSTTYTQTGGFPLNDQVGFTRSQIRGSDELRPERTTNVEFGAEMKFFSNRLGFDFTIYKSNSRDQIFDVPVSNGTGYTRFTTNAGEIENRGIELTLTGSPIRTSDLNWTTTLNFTRNRNTVVDLAEGFEGGFQIGSQFGYVGSTVSMSLTEGAPYGNLYGTSFQRYFAGGEPEDVESLDRDLPLLIGADGFPVRNTNQLIIGNAQPKWLLGFRNSIDYKGFNFSFVIDVRYDIDQYNQYGNFLTAFGKDANTANRNEVVVFDGFLADGTRNTREVWLGQGIGPDGVNYGDGYYRNVLRRLSEPFVQDASFVKLRTASLTYSLPTGMLTKTPFQSVSVSASVNNIILWTPWNGYDPESFSGGAGSNVTGFTGLDYPGVATTVFSLNLTL